MTHVCSVYGPYALSMVVRRPTKCCPRSNGAAERPPPLGRRANGVRPSGLSLQSPPGPLPLMRRGDQRAANPTALQCSAPALQRCFTSRYNYTVHLQTTRYFYFTLVTTHYAFLFRTSPKNSFQIPFFTA